MIDGNTHALNEYHNQQDISESEWELSKEEKCHKIVEYAVKLMRGDCTDREFEWVFSEFINLYDGETFGDMLDCWVIGEDQPKVRNICLYALEGASQILYDTELSEMSYFNQSDWTNIMLDELINRGTA